MSAPAPEISVVIPSWNTRELLRTCLRTLAAADKPSTEVIVVENGSEDGSGDMVAEEFPDVILERNAQNEGFAKGCNQGMRLARGRYVFLLNTDTEVRPDALRRLHDFLETHPDHGAVAPRLIHPDGRTQPTVMSFPRLRTALFFATPLERWFPESRELRRYFLRDWDQESSRDVDQPPAAAFLVRKSVLDEVGLFDEQLWLFFNDVDLSKRMWDAGHRTHYLAEALIVHHVGKSTSKFADYLPQYQRNRLHYYRKHHARLGSAWVKACTATTLADHVVRQGWARLRGKPAEPVRPFVKLWWELLFA